MIFKKKGGNFDYLDDDVVGGGDGAHVDVLGDEEEVLVGEPRHGVVQHGAGGRVLVVSLQKLRESNFLTTLVIIIKYGTVKMC